MSEPGEEKGRLAPTLLLAALVVLAVVLRLWQLGHWGFEGDEIYTLRDSLNPRLSNPRPLLFLLNYYVVQALMPLDELGLRILPAIAGALAIPAFYGVTQRLVGTRAALFGALLLTINPMHVYQSQYARYWSLVFLFSALYPYAMFLGIRDRSGRWLALGVVAGLLALLAHPVSALLLGGLGVFLGLQLRRDLVARLWSQKRVRWLVVLGAALFLIVAVRSIDMLQGWITSHDVSTRVADHLRDGRRGPVIKQLTILLGFVDGLTLPVTLIGMVGVCLVWQRGSRTLGLFLACLIIVPTAFILLISSRTPVSVTYLIPLAPALFIGAGVFLGRLTEVDVGLRPRWLLSATVTAVVMAVGMPTLISQYRDGRRWDFRGAAHWLEPRLAPGDVVFSAESRVTDHYLRGGQVVPLALDSIPLIRSARELHQAGRGKLWIVAPAPSHAFRSNLKRGGLTSWIFQHCQLRNSLGVGRLDFRQQYLHIYRCPPAGPGAVGE